MILCGLSALALPRGAWALQPLEAFVSAAREGSPDNLEAQAGALQQQAQADVALGRTLPGLSARGTYTRNQYATEISLPLDPTAPPATITITPHNQLDATFTLSVPLVDLASFQRVSAARTSAEASAHQVDATALQVEANVVQGYYQLLANSALVEAAQRALEVARASLRLSEERFSAGSAPALEVDRAKAEVERQTQQLTSAQLQEALAVRSLQSATGLTPELTGSPAPLGDDLHEEPPLESFVPGDPALPQLAVAQANTRAAEKQARAQRLTLIPSLSASVTERLTNAAGFSGRSSSYQAMVNLNWSLDMTTFANIRAQDAGVSAAQAREERTRRAAHDSIHRTWRQVQASLARSRSARAEQDASAHAADRAKDRYEVGSATQLELLQAQRDAFSAEVSRIQADADLANARLQLRIASGQDPFASK
ncbi:TolC family protein [Hyalangium versicolor]|uniref:TolC family protein n=1 Tax=Hyalangium versicolor TaxID=2861190 RepID=UPI001CCF7E95|nr:TolC family protein [Hyalangium versicolor]